MFSGAISVRIRSEDEILLIRSKAFWFANKLGFDKYRAGIITTLISSMARLVLSFAKTGRVDLLSVHQKTRSGITAVASIEGMERLEMEKKYSDIHGLFRHVNLEALTAVHIIDDYRILPADNREAVMQITKWT
jgi:serine/threonine-protein kinase RsbT